MAECCAYSVSVFEDNCENMIDKLNEEQRIA